MKSKSKLIDVIYPISAYVLWGSLFVVTKYTSGKLSIITLAFFRSLIACIALYAILLYRRKPWVPIAKPDRKYFVAIGFMGYFFNTVFNMAGVKYAGATLSSFVTIINPFTISLLAALILKERLTWKKLLCIFLVMGGVLVTTQSYAYESGAILGVLLILCSIVNWSFASVYIRMVSSRYDALTITFYCMLISMVLHIPAFTVDMLFLSDFPLDMPMFLSLVYMGVVGTAFTMLLWNQSLARLEASTCSLFFPVQAFVSAFLSAWLLGEQIKPVYYLGMALCMAGIILNFVFTGKDNAPLDSGSSGNAPLDPPPPDGALSGKA